MRKLLILCFASLLSSTAFAHTGTCRFGTLSPDAEKVLYHLQNMTEFFVIKSFKQGKKKSLILPMNALIRSSPYDHEIVNFLEKLSGKVPEKYYEHFSKDKDSIDSILSMTEDPDLNFLKPEIFGATNLKTLEIPSGLSKKTYLHHENFKILVNMYIKVHKTCCKEPYISR